MSGQTPKKGVKGQGKKSAPKPSVQTAAPVPRKAPSLRVAQAVYRPTVYSKPDRRLAARAAMGTKLTPTERLALNSSMEKSPIGGSSPPVGNPNVNHNRMDRKKLAGGPAGVGLSSCAVWYAKALVNPFGQFEELPCVPTSPAMMTQKWRAVTRGSFTSFAGPNAIAFVAVSPQNPGNNQSSIYASNGSVSTGVITTGAAATGIQRNTLPYPLASFSPLLIQARLVGCGLRVRNITQALNVGGLLYAIQGTRSTDLTTWTATQIKADPRTVLVPQALSEQTEWSVMVWRPNETSDLDLDGDFSLPSSLSMAFVADNPGSTAQTFEFELVEFWEYASGGPGVTVPELTIQHADPVGLARVSEAFQNPPNTLKIEDWARDGAQSIVEAIERSDTVAKTVEDMLGFAGIASSAVVPMVKSLLTTFLM